MTQFSSSQVSEKSAGTTNVAQNIVFDSTRRDSEKSCDFEEAISASGFGKFNIYVILIGISTGLLCVFEARLMSFVVPTAQCDLHLNIQEKAILKAIPLIGMVLTYPIWGFVGDIVGRKKLIICMCFLSFFCMVAAAFSQSFGSLLITRLLGGVTSSGIYPTLSSYLAEIHNAKYRAVMQLFVGGIYGLGDFLLPLLALFILTKPDSYYISEELIIYPWNLYLFACCIPALLSGFGFLCLPESPKFLMSKSDHEKAIKTFQSIYTINTNNARTQYPIKYLKTEDNTFKKDSETKCLSQCRLQFSLLCSKKHLINLVLTISAQFLITMGLNAILLWLPQILQEMSNHQRKHNTTGTVCDTLYDLELKNNDHNDICEEDVSQNARIYIYCIITASTTILVFFASGHIIHSIGMKNLLYILGVFTSLASFLLIYAEDFPVTVALASIVCAFGNIGFNALTAIVVELFPTNLRAISVSLTMMTGKLGGVFGCFIFPLLLNFGCTVSFMFISYFSLVWVYLVYLIPNPTQPGNIR